jgi:NAD(P)-dependent dehydrogenase (short-subunit alcohol dehydrogenase family)
MAILNFPANLSINQNQIAITLKPTMALFKQLFETLPYPTSSFAGETVIITGSNTGLGKEAARHIARLGAETLILAVRNLEKGEAAKRDIELSTKCGKDVIQVWHLDMANYSSVLKFVERAQSLQRVDVLLANAAIATFNFVMAEENESTLTVNVVSTFLLVLCLIPKMRETAEKFGTRPVVSVVSSGAHKSAKFPERFAPEGKILSTLTSDEKFDAMQRYPTSKLLEVFCLKHIGEFHPELSVTVNDVNPGFCHSYVYRPSHCGAKRI